VMFGNGEWNRENESESIINIVMVINYCIVR